MITVISREKSAFDGRAVSSSSVPLFELCILCASELSDVPQQGADIEVNNFDVDEDGEPYEVYCAPGSIIIVPAESKKFILDSMFKWYEWNPSDPGNQSVA